MSSVGVWDWDLKLQQDVALKKGLVQQGMPLQQVLIRFVVKSQILKCECLGMRLGNNI